MYLLDETWQAVFLPHQYLRSRVHVLVWMRCWRLLKHIGMLRPLYQIDTGTVGVQLVLAQHQGEAADAPDWNDKRFHHNFDLLRAALRVQGHVEGG